MCHNIGIPPISIMGFGFNIVSSLILLPNPPAKSTDFNVFHYRCVLYRVSLKLITTNDQIFKIDITGCFNNFNNIILNSLN